MYRPVRLAALLLVVAASTACGRKQAETAPAPSTTTSDERERARRDSIDRANAERERLDRERLDRERIARERVEEARRTMEAVIYFGYDRSDLTVEARNTLDAKLPLFGANRDVRIVIEGHTDERGSDEYNLALAQRRAAAAKRYLTQRGIAAERIEIRSLGEEQPVCTEEQESCWSRNRRDEFRVTTGALVAMPE